MKELFLSMISLCVDNKACFIPFPSQTQQRNFYSQTLLSWSTVHNQRRVFFKGFYTYIKQLLTIPFTDPAEELLLTEGDDGFTSRRFFKEGVELV